jgi:hypothetical protein
LLPFWASSIIALTAYLVLVDNFIIYFPIIPTIIVAYYTNLILTSATEKRRIISKIQKKVPNPLFCTVYGTKSVVIFIKIHFYSGSKAIRLTALRITIRI